MDIVTLSAGDARWAAALPVLQELRPHLTEAMLAQVLAEAPAQQLSFIGAFDGDECLGVAGFRIMTTTNVGRKLYVDDLVTSSGRRSTGVGQAMLRHLEALASEAECATLELDSGVQRFDAHRFYLRERFHISSHHFVKPLHPGQAV